MSVMALNEYILASKRYAQQILAFDYSIVSGIAKQFNS